MSPGSGLVAWTIVLPLAGAVLTLLVGHRGPLLALIATGATEGRLAPAALSLRRSRARSAVF